MESFMNNQMAQSHDESGWSAYVDDFPQLNHTEDTYYCSNPSLVSDAAWTGSFQHKNTENVKKPSSKNRPSSRKKFFWQDDDDDDLEDTANSHMTSPKVKSMKMKMKMDSNYKRNEDKMVTREGDSEKSINMNERENEYFDLKKKGLCLVPYSSFNDYNEYVG